MTAHDPRLRNSIGFHLRVSDEAARKRQAVLLIVEHQFTAAEFSALMSDLAAGKLDVRLYDDGIVLMRQY